MDQTKHLLSSNLHLHAQLARERLALTQAAVSKLTTLPLEGIVAVEIGVNAHLTLDELISLAIFLGLTEIGEPRPRIKGS